MNDQIVVGPSRASEPLAQPYLNGHSLWRHLAIIGLFDVFVVSPMRQEKLDKSLDWIARLWSARINAPCISIAPLRLEAFEAP